MQTYIQKPNQDIENNFKPTQQTKYLHLPVPSMIHKKDHIGTGFMSWPYEFSPLPLFFFKYLCII